MPGDLDVSHRMKRLRVYLIASLIMCLSLFLYSIIVPPKYTYPAFLRIGLINRQVEKCPTDLEKVALLNRNLQI